MSSARDSKGQGTLDSWLSPRSRSHHTRQARASASDQGSHDRPPGRFKAPRGNPAQRAALAAIAAETRTVLPDILKDLPNIHAAKSEALFLSTLPMLKATDCPQHPKTAISIVNEDTYNAAISLASEVPSRVAVLNMASHSHAGGGWLKGSMAQEEALCYRSSLTLSLHKRYYPFKQRMALYTPDVVIIRSDIPSGHKILDVKPGDLPVVSVLSVAALRCPDLKTVKQSNASGVVTDRQVFADPAARDLTKDKMRLCLRMAASRGHDTLVLGALGCGAFRNPKREVAHCWLEVLREKEFEGGWWRRLVFAIFDTRKEGNFEVFDDILGGEMV
ncbi:uncharacterized protein F5Z01DRAFT_623608 [Emericellopsis atlantica]|uniref:Microbial-type PARG catalytic domain-containing protein n=1 Tax=Emericellopsis atlantica TaxID=2614577 RepID=A0A9P7ZKM6_9HYPO|nr:uncharacterized protein F5Z01DRAFT_623608 [Emericellopsis atlantica]KAG9253492.1 hypothetical protein F5Z01DRAFT_623608 [Emericellopsis atlantica]